MAEMEEAGELAFEAKSEGSVGDQSGEPINFHKHTLVVLGLLASKSKVARAVCVSGTDPLVMQGRVKYGARIGTLPQ